MAHHSLDHTHPSKHNNGKGKEKKKWPGYCKTIMVTDSHGGVKELVFPKALDLDRPKRERTTFSADQLGRLEEEFRLNQYMVGKDRTSLARNLGLSETQVKVWFQNRRTKHKKDKEKRVENVDSQAESQAAQNVLRLLEYKTAFGYNTSLGGQMTATSSILCQPVEVSNTTSASRMSTSSTVSSGFADSRRSPPCPIDLTHGAPFKIDADSNASSLSKHTFLKSCCRSDNCKTSFLEQSGLPQQNPHSTLPQDYCFSLPRSTPCFMQPEVYYPQKFENLQLAGVDSIRKTISNTTTPRPAPMLNIIPDITKYGIPRVPGQSQRPEQLQDFVQDYGGFQNGQPRHKALVPTVGQRQGAVYNAPVLPRVRHCHYTQSFPSTTYNPERQFGPWHS